MSRPQNSSLGRNDPCPCGSGKGGSEGQVPNSFKGQFCEIELNPRLISDDA